MKQKSKLLLSSILCSTLACGFSQASIAQDDAEEAVLDEIMVTATRRGNTSLMETPTAITAMDTKAIEKYSPRDLNDMAIMVPSLTAGTAAGFNVASFALRGVSETSIIIYKESPVGVTLDDFVYPSIQTSNLEMFDIEQVEILRGPQGTLFGKNTTGGVINVRTKRPVMNEGSGDFRFEYGSFGTTKGTVALNIPIVEDELALRIAGMYLKSDGYVKNGYDRAPLEGDGRMLGGDNVFSGRAKLLWEPSEDASLLIQYERIRDNSETPSLINEAGPGYVFEDFFGLGEGTQEDPLDRGGLTFRDDIAFNMEDGAQVDVDGWYLNGEFGIGDDLTLYTVTGYRDQKSRLINNYTGTSGQISLFDASRDDDRQTFQHEMRLASDSDGSFNWVAGVFYQKNDAQFCVTQYVGFLDFFGLTPDIIFGPGTYAPGGFNTNAVAMCNTQDASAIAGFADGTIDVSDDLHISAGIRYTEEKKTWMGRPRIPFNQIEAGLAWSDLDELLDAADFDRFPSEVVTNSHKWTEPSYRINIAYDVNDDTMAYASYSHSFKSGGYNDQLGTSLRPIPDFAADPTRPEKADSFEVGVKSTFMDGRSTMALTAYHTTYNDAQRTFNVTTPSGTQTTLFFNAAKMRVKGFEFEASFMAAEDFVLRTAASYTDADYLSFEADTDYDGMIDVDLSGQDVTRAPKWKVGGDANYTVDFAGGTLDFNGQVAHESVAIASYSAVGPEYDTTQQAKTLVNASITYRDADEKYHIRLVGRNLTDRRYRTGSLSVADLWIMSSYAPPRYLGIELGTKFGM